MAARCATPRENNGYCSQTITSKPADQAMNTRLPEVRINKRAERPRRYAPDISGTDEALPRDISLSGEHEALPAPLFATLQKLTFPQGSCILTDLILALQAVFLQIAPIPRHSCRKQGNDGRPAAPTSALRDAHEARPASSGGYHLMIFATTPAPTVRPPSRIAKRRPSSIATGLISVTTILMLSPGITISTPSGKVTAPVMSVVRK